jgi:putative ABC transport system permease protein
MLRLALSTVRGRWPALAGAFAALALGAALIISAVQVMVATSDAVPAGPQRYRAVPVVVTAPVALRRLVAGEVETEPNPRRGALSPTLAARVAALPQVRRAVIDRAVHVRTPAGEAIVARPWSTRFGARLLSGRAPSAPGELALSKGSDPSTLCSHEKPCSERNRILRGSDPLGLVTAAG